MSSVAKLQTCKPNPSIWTKDQVYRFDPTVAAFDMSKPAQVFHSQQVSSARTLNFTSSSCSLTSWRRHCDMLNNQRNMALLFRTCLYVVFWWVFISCYHVAWQIWRSPDRFFLLFVVEGLCCLARVVSSLKYPQATFGQAMDAFSHLPLASTMSPR